MFAITRNIITTKCTLIIDEPSTYDMMVTDERPPADIEDMLIRNQVKLVVAGRSL